MNKKPGDAVLGYESLRKKKPSRALHHRRNKRMRSVRYFIWLTLALCLNTCKDTGNPVNGKPPCPPIRIGAPSPYSEPVWHPSGQFIGFNYLPLVRITYPYGEHCQGQYEWNLDSSGYWLVNPDGTSLRRILPYFLEMVSWSPDGESIVFGAGAQIFKMRFTGTTFDTTTVTQLTFEGRNFFPAWSPDGEWIAYDSNSESPNGMNFIWLMRRDGSEKRRITYEPSQGEIRMPHWSANGNKITHIRYLVGAFSSEIFSMDSNGTNPKRLTLNNSTDYYPRYSPDPAIGGAGGTKIAFWSKLGDGLGNIWVMNADGSNPQQLTTEGTTDWLSWSPDGRRIVYVNHSWTDWTYANGTIWVVNVETGEKQQLTFNHPKK